MNLTAQEKLDNLETLAHCAKAQGFAANITIDEDGYYIIGNLMFADYKSALKFITSINE